MKRILIILTIISLVGCSEDDRDNNIESNLLLKKITTDLGLDTPTNEEFEGYVNFSYEGNKLTSVFEFWEEDGRRLTYNYFYTNDIITRIEITSENWDKNSKVIYYLDYDNNDRLIKFSTVFEGNIDDSNSSIPNRTFDFYYNTGSENRIDYDSFFKMGSIERNEFGSLYMKNNLVNRLEDNNFTNTFTYDNFNSPISNIVGIEKLSMVLNLVEIFPLSSFISHTNNYSKIELSNLIEYEFTNRYNESNYPSKIIIDDDTDTPWFLLLEY